MVLEVADDPDPTVVKEQHPWFACHSLRRHDVQLHGTSILGDGPFRGGQYLRALSGSCQMSRGNLVKDMHWF